MIVNPVPLDECPWRLRTVHFGPPTDNYSRYTFAKFDHVRSLARLRALRHARHDILEYCCTDRITRQPKLSLDMTQRARLARYLCKSFPLCNNARNECASDKRNNRGDSGARRWEARRNLQRENPDGSPHRDVSVVRNKPISSRSCTRCNNASVNLSQDGN